MYQEQASIFYTIGQPIQTTTPMLQTPKAQTLRPQMQNIPKNRYYISTQELNVSDKQTQSQNSMPYIQEGQPILKTIPPQQIPQQNQIQIVPYQYQTTYQ